MKIYQLLAKDLFPIFNPIKLRPQNAELVWRACRRWLGFRTTCESWCIVFRLGWLVAAAVLVVVVMAAAVVLVALMISERRLLREWMLDEAECFFVMRRIRGDLWAKMSVRLWVGLLVWSWGLSRWDWAGGGDEVVDTGLQVCESRDAASLLWSARYPCRGSSTGCGEAGPGEWAFEGMLLLLVLRIEDGRWASSVGRLLRETLASVGNGFSEPAVRGRGVGSGVK